MKFLKKIVLSSLLSMFVLSNISFANENSVLMLGSNSEKKIKWEEAFINIDYITKDKNIIIEKGFNPDNLFEELNKGLSGELLSYSQNKIGKIKTSLGEFELIWHREKNSSLENYICNKEGLCVPFKIKNANSEDIKYMNDKKNDFAENQGIIYGNFKNLIDKSNLLDINKNQEIGIAVINILDFVKNKPFFNETVLYTDKEISHITWDSESTTENSLTTKKGVLKTQNGNFPIYTISNGSEIHLMLNENIRLYTRKTIIDNTEVFTIFYLEYDKEEGSFLTITELANVYKTDLFSI